MKSLLQFSITWIYMLFLKHATLEMLCCKNNYSERDIAFTHAALAKVKSVTQLFCTSRQYGIWGRNERHTSYSGI